VSFKIRKEKTFVVVEIQSTLKEIHRKSFSETIDQAMALPFSQIGIDLRKITKIDSYAVGMLIKAWKSGESVGKKVFVLVDPEKGSQIDGVIKELNLASIIPIFHEEGEVG